MGQKVHPTGIRLGIVKDWASKWYADSKAFPGYISADHSIRVHIKKKLKPYWHRTSCQQGQYHDSYGTAGHRNWQEGRGHREAARRSIENDWYGHPGCPDQH
jgi:hypothetical protein